MDADLAQENDVASTNPEVLKRLSEKMIKVNKGVPSNSPVWKNLPEKPVWKKQKWNKKK